MGRADTHHLAKLCRWAAGVAIGDLPGPVMVQAVNVLGDDLAAIVSARGDPVLTAVRDLSLSSGGRAEASVFDGTGRRSDRYTAALVNGAAAPWNELDEGSRRIPCHAGIYALPALLAEAEAQEISTQEVLRALVVAYETVTRFALAFPQPDLKLHPHAAYAAIGAAAAAAAVRRFDAAQFANALTIAATLVNPGPFDHAVRGSLARNMWVGHAAWNGLRAADWAACGIDGLAEGPRDVFCGIFGCGFAPEQLSAGLGSEWLILQNFQKIYPCCQYAHSTIEAMAELLSKLPPPFKARDATDIVIDIHSKGLKLAQYDPPTMLSARFSVPHIAAVMAARGRIDTETLAPDSLTDREVMALRRRVVLQPYQPELPPPNDRPARVTLKFSDGRVFTAECLSAQGSPATPLAPEAIRQKIASICAPVYPDLPTVFARLARLDDAALLTPWRDLVGEIVSQRMT